MHLPQQRQPVLAAAPPRTLLGAAAPRGVTPLGKGGGGGGGGGYNPCPNGRTVCAALGRCTSDPYSGACGTREHASVIGSCSLYGQSGQLCCCTPFSY